jgi:hypothetical protein
MPFLTKRVSVAHKRAITDYLVAQAPELVRAIPEKEVVLSFPHKQYIIRGDVLAEGGDLAAAFKSSTRILVATIEEQVLAVAEVYEEKEGPYPIMLLTGEAIKPFLNGLTKIEDSVAYKEAENIELRTLNLVGLAMTAIWLHTATREIVMPIGRLPKGIKPNYLYEADAFFRKVRPIAVSQLEQDYVRLLNKRIGLEQERIKLEYKRIALEEERIANTVRENAGNSKCSLSLSIRKEEQM